MDEKYGFFKALKDLFKYSKENKNKYILGTIFMIIFVITSMFYTTMNSKLIANIMSLNLDKAIRLVVICALLRIFSITFCHNQYRRIVIKAGEEISATIQKKIYSKVLNLSMSSFENMKSGKIFTTIKAADSGMMSTISQLLQESAYVATSVVMLFVIYFIDWKIGLGVTAISAISLLLFKIQLDKSKKYLKSEFDYADNYSTLVNETTRGFKEIKAQVEGFLANKEYNKALDAFASIKPLVDNLFDNVMIMDKDEAVKANRLGLLKQIYDTMLTICDLSKIVYK